MGSDDRVSAFAGLGCSAGVHGGDQCTGHATVQRRAAAGHLAAVRRSCGHPAAVAATRFLVGGDDAAGEGQLSGGRMPESH